MFLELSTSVDIPLTVSDSLSISEPNAKSTSVDIFFIVSTHSVHMIIIVSMQVDIPLTVSTFSTIVASSNLP